MRCQRPWCLLLLSLLLPTLLHAQQFCAYRMRTHATDCTLLTDGEACDLCYEVDQSRLWSCVPTVAGEVCSGSEWKEIKFVVTDADVPDTITVSNYVQGGSLIDDQFCTWNAATSQIDCATAPPGGGSNVISGDDGLLYFDPATPAESEWYIGPNHDGGGDDDDCYELRQSPTPGTNVRLSVCPDGSLSTPSSTTSDATQEMFERSSNGTGSILEGINGNLANVQKDCRYDANGELPATCLSNTVLLQTELITKSIYWPAGSLSTDGTNCATPTEQTIGGAGGPKQYTIICTNNAASRIMGRVMMPDSWNAGTVTFKVSYVQTAANTASLNLSVACQARGPGEAINATYGTEVALSDTNVTGSNAVDHLTSTAVTCNCTTSCQAGDSLSWYLDVETSTATAMATLHFLGVLMEYAGVPSD